MAKIAEWNGERYALAEPDFRTPLFLNQAVHIWVDILKVQTMQGFNQGMEWRELCHRTFADFTDNDWDSNPRRWQLRLHRVRDEILARGKYQKIDFVRDRANEFDASSTETRICCLRSGSVYELKKQSKEIATASTHIKKATERGELFDLPTNVPQRVMEDVVKKLNDSTALTADEKTKLIAAFAVETVKAGSLTYEALLGTLDSQKAIEMKDKEYIDKGLAKDYTIKAEERRLKKQKERLDSLKKIRDIMGKVDEKDET